MTTAQMAEMTTEQKAEFDKMYKKSLRHCMQGICLQDTKIIDNKLTNLLFRKACEAGYIELVRYMIEKEATDLNRGLVEAAKGGHLDVVKLIIERRNNP